MYYTILASTSRGNFMQSPMHLLLNRHSCYIDRIYTQILHTHIGGRIKALSIIFKHTLTSNSPASFTHLFTANVLAPEIVRLVGLSRGSAKIVRVRSSRTSVDEPHPSWGRCVSSGGGLWSRPRRRNSVTT